MKSENTVPLQVPVEIRYKNSYRCWTLVGIKYKCALRVWQIGMGRYQKSVHREVANAKPY